MTAVRVLAVARSAVCGIDGGLAGWHPVKLGAVVGRETLERAGISAAEVDEVIVGCADPVGACGADAARAVALCAGWPVEVGGQVVDRAETSGMAAVQAAVAAILAGHADTVLVMGLGLCSVVPPGAGAVSRSYGMPWAGVAERFADRGGLLPPPRLAEQSAAAAGLERSELDSAAERSRRRREAAGTSAAIVAVAARPGNSAGGVRAGRALIADAIRAWGDTESLMPAFGDEGPLTTATFAPPADAVTALLLQAAPPPHTSGDSYRGAMHTTDEVGSSGLVTETRGELPATPTTLTAPRLTSGGRGESPVALGIVMGTGRAAGDPFDPTGGVSVAVRQALSHTSVGLNEVDEIVVSEQDAATLLLVAASLGIEPGRVNRAGGALATGHAGAAEELRLITDTLADRTGSTTVMLTISAGSVGSAAILWGADSGRRP